MGNERIHHTASLLLMYLPAFFFALRRGNFQKAPRGKMFYSAGECGNFTSLKPLSYFAGSSGTVCHLSSEPRSDLIPIVSVSVPSSHLPPSCTFASHSSTFLLLTYFRPGCPGLALLGCLTLLSSFRRANGGRRTGCVPRGPR
jgi:hypothetical protein